MGHCTVGVCSSPVHCKEIGGCFSSRPRVSITTPAKRSPTVVVATHWPTEMVQVLKKDESSGRLAHAMWSAYQASLDDGK